jgi:putative oxidoreductase
MFPHGAQKLLGWFGGHGYTNTISFFTQNMGIPSPLAFLVIVIEFFGAIALVVGFLGRLAALGIGTVLAVAAFKVNLVNGFFMNWNGNNAGEGYEYHILGAAIALALVITGSGMLSLDRKLGGEK